MKDRIYFCIETKVREFYARIFFSIIAANRGYSSVIGSRGHFYRFRNKIKRGIFISNGNTTRLSYISELFKKLGFNIVHLDEEGAITFDFEHHIFRFDFEIFKKIDAFFTVGQREKDAILSNNLQGNPEKKIFVTGNVRFDLNDKKFFKLYEEDINKIRKKYGRFILITTKFNKINYLKRNDDLDYIESLIKSGYMRRDVDRYYSEESIKNDNKTKNNLENFLGNIDEKFPNSKFLLKPHPGEDFEYWVKFKEKIKQKNLEIIPVNEFHTNSFILASDFIIASNCTTLLEAYLFEKLGINFLPYQNNKIHYELTKNISINCFSKKELVEQVKKIIDTKKFQKKKLNTKEIELLEYTINNTKENAVNEMLINLESLRIKDRSSDKVSLNSFLFIYKFKQFLIKIYKYFFIKDRYLSKKEKYLFQKNPGIEIKEIVKVKDVICDILSLNKNQFSVELLKPGLFVIEKNSDG